MYNDRKKRVFQIISHFDLGGAERVAVNIAKAQSREFEFHVIEVAKGSGDYSQMLLKELGESHVRCHRSWISNNKWAIVCFPLRLLVLLLAYRPSVIHTHTEVPDLSVWLSFKCFGLLMRKVRLVRTIHNTQLWNEWAGIGRRVEPFFVSRKANVAISIGAQEAYHQKFRCLAPVIYNGVEQKSQLPFSGIVPGKVNVLFAGRLEPQKGIETLVKVVQQMQDNYKVFFHIVGSGSLGHQLQAIAHQSNVRLYNKVYNLSSYLASFDYVFMPSEFEGLGLLSVEASFASTPTIINICPGLAETLPGNWKYKVEGNRVEDYQEIFSHLDNEADRRKWGRIAYDFAQKTFTVTRMQNEYMEFYQRT